MWQRTVKVVKFSEFNRTSTKEALAMERVRQISWNDQTITLTASPQLEKELAVGVLLLEYGKQWAVDAIDLDGDTINCRGNGCPFEPRDRVDVKTGPEGIYQLTAQFSEAAILYKDTGATHSAALCRVNKLSEHAEDIDPKSAIYKAVGQVQDWGGVTALQLSSTIDKSVVRWAVLLGISLIISRGSVTDGAVDLANELDVTLVGYARGLRFTVFTGRI